MKHPSGRNACLCYGRQACLLQDRFAGSKLPLIESSKHYGKAQNLIEWPQLEK